MRIKVLVAKSLLASIPLTLIPTLAISAPKVTPGTKCKVLNQKVPSMNKTYTCIKSGKKLIWNKGVVITPKSIDSAPMNYSLPSQPTSNIELCKTKEKSSSRSNYQNALPTGFPISKFKFAEKNGTVKWALIPIDFPDKQGEKDFKSRIDDQMKLLSEWFATVSEGKFKIEWVVQEQWITLPSASTEYVIPLSVNLNNAANGPKLFKDAMNAADPVFNFTNVQTVNFILPSGQTFIGEGSQGFPWDQAVKEYVSNEGPISSYSIPGKFFDVPERKYWSYWAHEFGHAMGIPHIGSSRIANPYLVLDLMGSQDGYTRELSGWLRFLAGWLDDEKIYCQEYSKLDKTEITLAPLSGSASGIKMVVIPVSDSKSLIIESRRETKFSCTMPTKRNGILAYLYDSALGHGEDFLIPVGQELGRAAVGSLDCIVNQYPDPLLYEGQKLSVEGVTIEVLKSQNFDKIRISKAN